MKRELKEKYDLAELREIIHELRGEGGCPWDRSLDYVSLKPFILDEAQEVQEAVDHGDMDNLCEELGDVLLQLLLYADMAEADGYFDFDSVITSCARKMIRRHPHVFGDVVAKDPAAVLKNWEQIKQTEHRKESRHSALDGVPDALPGLIKAQRVQEKAARVGFDWKDAEGPLEKIKEEIRELEAEIAARKSENPADSAVVKEEFGDLVFAVCNLARHLKIDAESAAQGATAKFAKRFRLVEAAAKEKGRRLEDMTLAEMDELWDEAKKK